MCDFLKVIIIPTATLLSALIGCCAVWWTARSLDKRSFREKIGSVLARLDVHDELAGRMKQDIHTPVAEAVFSIAPILRDSSYLMTCYNDYAIFCKDLNSSKDLTSTYVNMMQDASKKEQAKLLLGKIIGSI